MKKIKKLFYTYRNGAVADTLRRYGIPHKIIFGLQVPQLAEIARSLTFDTMAEKADVADQLWADREVRESRLLATYLFQPENTGIEKAYQLASDIRTQEEADMLSFRLFKRMPDAKNLLERLETEKHSDAITACASSLRRHLE